MYLNRDYNSHKYSYLDGVLCPSAVCHRFYQHSKHCSFLINSLLLCYWGHLKYLIINILLKVHFKYVNTSTYSHLSLPLSCGLYPVFRKKASRFKQMYLSNYIISRIGTLLLTVDFESLMHLFHQSLLCSF
jgi:hypothetical protein